MTTILFKFSKPWEKRELRNDQTGGTREYDDDNFLFMSAGDGFIIRGMHYPDNAFTEEDGIPLVYKTSEERVMVAAFPQTLIKAILEILAYEFEEEEFEETWERVLQGLSDSAKEKIENGEINEPF